jgi:NAD(P)-dependent dehydrogenase (short-subunit alcohol dehydrogenase family)
VNRLKDKIALITGAAGGMGAAEAALFAEEGAAVILTDVQDELGRGTAREIEKSGGSAVYRHLDVSDEHEWAKTITWVETQYGRLDVVVNNAGIFSGRMGRLVDYTVDDWDRVIAVNATGVFLGTRHGALSMRKTGGGSIVNISSVYGLVGAPGEAPYPASKGAVRSFTKAAAVQLAPDKIRVNSVHPGFIDTPQSASLMDDPAQRAKLIERTPIGRIGTSEDVAWGVLYLASDESNYMTGAEFVIDGGVTAQ